jgi:integrase
MASHQSTTRARLTKTVVEALPEGTHWDADLKGFGVRVSALGTITYFVHGRMPSGRQVKCKVGRHGMITAEQARARAKALLGAISSGQDPAKEKRQERKAKRERRAAPTMTDLWTRYSLEVVAGNKPTTAHEKARMWQSRIEPAVGNVVVQDVDAARLARIIHAPLRFDPKTQLIVGGKGEAGNLYRFLHHMMRKAIIWRLRPDNPLDGIDQPRVARRTRLLRDAEVTALWAALAEIAPSMPWQVAAAMRFALQTGWRASEVVKLQHAHLYRDRGEARLPDTKTEFSVRPLAAEVFAEIDALPRIVGSPWVFPSIGSASEPLSYNTFEKAFKRVRTKAGLTGVSLHTLRHRIVTDIAGAAQNMREGMAVSGHKSVTAFMNYVHADRDRVATIAAAITARVSGLADVRSDANVAQLPQKAG